MKRVAIRCGNNRIVLLIGRWAIKLPRARSWRGLCYGMLNNINEAEASAHAFACPVVFALRSGLAVIMRRARDLDEIEQSFVRDLADTFSQAGLTVEPKPDSFGVLDGHIVAVDYGVPRELRW